MQAQGGLSIQRMCELATVSRASFYRHWEEKNPTEAEMALRDVIQRMAIGHRFYGYRRITVLVQREGYVVGTKKVRRLMKQDNLLAVRRRKFVTTTDSDHDFVVYPNLAEQLIVRDVNQLWVADITYVRLLKEFVYLAVVLDAFSRRAVGWALSRSLQACLPLAALENAIHSRQPRAGLVHHSDRGSQYASNDYVKRLESIGTVLSMSRAGRPWENGGGVDFHAAIRMDRAFAVLVIAEWLQRQGQQCRTLLGKHGGDLPFGGAMDAGVSPTFFPVVQVALSCLDTFKPQPFQWGIFGMADTPFHLAFSIRVPLRQGSGTVP